MFLGEHVLYGSSRLGVATYKNLKLGYASGSLAYPSGPGFNVCYTEVDENEMESDREPMGGTPVGPIGGGNFEDIKPYGPHRVPGTRTPIVGINLPWAGATDNSVKPTRESTIFAPGRKRYEFSNHLGNVLVTVSDMPLGVDDNSDGIADYYMPDVKTTSDYEPFGAPLIERTFVEEQCTTYTTSDTTYAVNEGFNSTTAVSSPTWSWSSPSTVVTETDGNKALKITNTVLNNGVARWFTTTVGVTYTVSCRVKGDYQTNISIRRRLNSNTTTTQVVQAQTVSASSGYTTFSYTFTAEAGWTYYLMFISQSGNGITATLYWDDIKLYSVQQTSHTDCMPLVDSYRFGFNGKEKYDEWNGEGAMYDYGFRVYDPRIGKFLSVDPLAGKFAYYTPYQFAGNKPIWALDLDGLEDVVYWVTMNRNGTGAFIKETGYDILGKGVQHGTYIHITLKGGDQKDEIYRYYTVLTEPGNINKNYIQNLLEEGYAVWGSSSNDNGMSKRGGTSNSKGGIDEMVTPGGGAEPSRRISEVLGIAKQFVEWIVEIVEGSESKPAPLPPTEESTPDSIPYVKVKPDGSEDTMGLVPNAYSPNADKVIYESQYETGRVVYRCQGCKKPDSNDK